MSTPMLVAVIDGPGQSLAAPARLGTVAGAQGDGADAVVAIVWDDGERERLPLRRLRTAQQGETSIGVWLLADGLAAAARALNPLPETPAEPERVKRASYRRAVAGALNDSAGESDALDPVAAGELITAALVADIFGVSTEKVGRDVVRVRRKSSR